MKKFYDIKLYQKRDSGTDAFFCEFCEISHKTFYKEPFGRPLLHKRSYCLLSQHNLVPFQKRCHACFPVEYLLGLICRLRTRVSSIPAAGAFLRK